MVKKSFVVASELMTLEDKEEFLREIGQEDLISVFDSWTPKNQQSRGHRHSVSSAPLDQKMSLTVTRDDRKSFEYSLKELKDAGEEVSMSHFVRNKALGTPDIHDWKSLAVDCLKEMSDTLSRKKEINERVNSLSVMINDEKDDDIVNAYYVEQNDLKSRLAKLKGSATKRNQRLSGRVTFSESETIKWRAARLCLSTSDYLRMMIFDMTPDSEADRHMSLIARQRFYIAIGDIAKNGWGEAPEIRDCSQCDSLAARINALELENSQLRSLL